MTHGPAGARADLNGGSRSSDRAPADTGEQPNVLPQSTQTPDFSGKAKAIVEAARKMLFVPISGTDFSVGPFDTEYPVFKEAREAGLSFRVMDVKSGQIGIFKEGKLLGSVAHGGLTLGSREDVLAALSEEVSRLLSPTSRPLPPESPVLSPMPPESPVLRPVPPESPVLQPMPPESPERQPMPPQDPFRLSAEGVPDWAKRRETMPPIINEDGSINVFNRKGEVHAVVKPDSEHYQAFREAAEKGFFVLYDSNLTFSIVGQGLAYRKPDTYGFEEHFNEKTIGQRLEKAMDFADELRRRWARPDAAPASERS